MSDYKTKLAALPDGEYYDCRDNERLTHDSHADAVLEVVDFRHDPARTTEAVIRSMGDVCVKAYARRKVSDAWLKRTAADLIEQAEEAFDEEYGDPDGDERCDIATKKGDIEAVLRVAFADVTVWGCRVIGEVWLDADDVLALVRDHAPEWLDPPGGVA